MFDDTIVRLAVRAYVLSIPMLLKENDLIPLISKNQVAFLAGGWATIFMQKAGTALLQGAAAYHGPSAQQLFGVMPRGLEHLPAKVDASMQSNGVAVGEEFLWLSKVLPSAATGNWEPYKAEGTAPRQQMIAWARMVQQMNPTLFQIVVAKAQQAEPLIEQAIYSLVRQLNI